MNIEYIHNSNVLKMLKMIAWTVSDNKLLFFFVLLLYKYMRLSLSEMIKEFESFIWLKKINQVFVTLLKIK